MNNEKINCDNMDVRIVGRNWSMRRINSQAQYQPARAHGNPRRFVHQPKALGLCSASRADRPISYK